MRPPRILLAGGGTGGHVYPAIAIADALRRKMPEASIAFAGTKEKIEWRAVPRAGYPIHPITVQGFYRGSLTRNLGFPIKLAKGLLQSWNLIGHFDPDIVVGTGGYVSGPVLLSAHLRNRRLVIQEQNAFPGITNRVLGRYADAIHLAFQEALDYFDDSKCIVSGNPTREVLQKRNIESARAHFEIPEGAKVLFVFGGSLGSAAINSAMENMIQELLSMRQLHIIWQTGPMHFDDLSRRMIQHEKLRILQYVDRMDLAYSVADLVVSRAGAITCSELAVTATPSILVPSPNVAEDHQTKNAVSLERAGASVLIPENEMADRLLGAVTSALNDSNTLQRMSEAAKALSHPDAASRIAQSILDILSGDATKQ